MAEYYIRFSAVLSLPSLEALDYDRGRQQQVDARFAVGVEQDVFESLHAVLIFPPVWLSPAVFCRSS